MTSRLLLVFSLLSLLNFNCGGRKVKWSKRYKDGVEKELLQESMKNKNLDHSKSKKICDCMVDKFEEYYPVGLPRKISEDTMIYIVKKCDPEK